MSTRSRHRKRRCSKCGESFRSKGNRDWTCAPCLAEARRLAEADREAAADAARSFEPWMVGEEAEA